MILFSSMLSTLILVLSVMNLLPLECSGARISPLKYRFYRIGCKGTYDEIGFQKVDTICEECDKLFKENPGHLCRKNCFGSEYYNACGESLMRDDELPQLHKTMKQLQKIEMNRTTEQPKQVQRDGSLFSKLLNIFGLG